MELVFLLKDWLYSFVVKKEVVEGEREREEGWEKSLKWSRAVENNCIKCNNRNMTTSRDLTIFFIPQYMLDVPRAYVPTLDYEALQSIYLFKAHLKAKY